MSHDTNTTTPRVYVGTYHKYNCGSIAGAWIDLDEYDSEETFYDRCREIHRNESDPEFMFQDHECIPDGMIGESGFGELFWEWLALDEEDREKLRAVNNVAGADYFDDIESALERVVWQGSMRDFAWERAEMEFEQHTESRIWSYFDIEAYERDLDIEGYRQDEDTDYIVDMTY